jgi:hypothetical protein
MAKSLEKFASQAFLKALPDYIKIRDCYEGERAIKKAGVAYLPQLNGSSVEDYQNYKSRALFFPSTGKTCSSMVGLATLKPPKVDCPSEMDPYFSDDKDGHQFTEFYVGVFNEVVLMGRYGVLIDGPKNGGDPELSPYIAENIVRWEYNDQKQLISLMLRECRIIKVENDRFATKEIIVFRHCFIDGGVYQVEVLDEDLEVLESAIVPTFAGRTLNYIPFVCFGATGVHMEVDKPPMLDIATINISHYMTSADLEWGRHIVGLPTPVVTGVDTGSSLRIGGTAAWILPTADAKAYYLEFLGQGLGSLENAMKEKIGLMASVSARMVDNSTRGSEAAETVRLRYMNESASLIHIISSVESGVRILYTMLASLMQAAGTVAITFSREILGVGVTFKDLSTLLEAYLAGALSKEAFLYNLRRLEAVDPNRTDEEELAAIKDPPPRVDPTSEPRSKTEPQPQGA